MPSSNETNTSISKEEFLQVLQRNDFEVDVVIPNVSAHRSYGSVASANHTPASVGVLPNANPLNVSGSHSNDLQNSATQFFFGADFAVPTSNSVAIAIDNRTHSGK